jgi:DNA-binding NtrC family response regulator
MVPMSRVVHPESTLGVRPFGTARPADHHDLHILFECDRPLAGSTRHCLGDVDEVLFSRGADRSHRREMSAGVRRLTILVPDSQMGSPHARLRRVETGWAFEDASGEAATRSRSGAPLRDGSTFELGHTHFLLRSRALSTAPLDGPPDVVTPPSREPALTTLNHECEALFAQGIDAAKNGVPIILIGEAGSGKDTVAHGLHEEARRPGEFVSLDCSQLGRVAGANGANDDVLASLAGHFKCAADGTVFLNEIEGLSPASQLALLSILRSSPRPCGAAVISSVRSNHDLRPEVPRIRADLWAQLAGFTMPLHPLRERREDIGTLLSIVLSRVGGPDAGRLTMDATMGQALLLHVWPYNIAEFETCVRTAIALSTDQAIRWSPAALLHAPAPMVRVAPAEELPARPHEHHSGAATDPDLEFTQNVRRALKCNLSIAGLQKNALLHSKMVLEATKGSAATTVTVPALREIILSAIETMRNSSPRGEKQSQVLLLTFIKPTATQQEAADRLAMAFGTYRRYVTSALADLVSILWFSELSARMRTDRTSKGVSEINIARQSSFVRIG